MNESHKNLKPIILARAETQLELKAPERPSISLAVERVKRVVGLKLKRRIKVLCGGESCEKATVTAIICNEEEQSNRKILHDAGIVLSEAGQIAGLISRNGGEQGFVVGRLQESSGDKLVLVSNTETGLKNALLTLCDRLYIDNDGNVVADSFDGTHCPSALSRRIKTDLYSPSFRGYLDYWDLTSVEGINEFADWFASFRLTDYDLLTFARGWGLTYNSKRFPVLSDPTHPNCQKEVYSQLIERMHEWGLKVWASDIYVRSGYVMELAACPDMISPSAQRDKIHPFKAGHGSWPEISSGFSNAIACLSSSAAKKYYADLVTDILECNPGLDGLDFHIGHGINGLCKCPQCKDIKGNRDAVYRCFTHIYKAAQKQAPGVKLKVPIKIFGDVTRSIVEHYNEFPNLELFCWLRWQGNYMLESREVPITHGHEDGASGIGGGRCGKQKGIFDSWMPDPDKTMSDVRNYHRDYEPWLRHYSQRARMANIPGFSWEPHLHKELDNLYYLKSQLEWEPDISWSEFARRYVIRTERRLDPALTNAYSLALEANDAITLWGIPGMGTGFEQGTSAFVFQHEGLFETKLVRDKIEALRENIKQLGIEDYPMSEPPESFDLRWSLNKTLLRLDAKETLIFQH